MTAKTQLWTHASVLKLAKGTDPVEAVTRLAREMVLNAIEQGWTGPPYDPFALAQLLGHSLVPREDILDARTVPVEQGRLQIEFNPNKPKGRQRYSVSHEIAHTLFPDCKDRIRHRLAREQMQKDDWQLEVLCNIAAAELLMPIGSFPDLRQSGLSIDKLMTLRKEFDVSTEALVLRFVRLTDHPCFVFCASRREDAAPKDRYAVDYIVPSKSWTSKIASGAVLPETSIVKDCTAIGYTAKADEQWPGLSDKLHVEAVGIPPFPGHRFPRVVALATIPTEERSQRLRILTLRGDALHPRGDGFRIIAHIVNDRAARWGGGFALAVRRRLPKAQEEFVDWTTKHKPDFRLGAFHLSVLEDNLAVASMVCQHGYGPSRIPRIRYGPLGICLAELRQAAKARSATVHMPRIGCGQAGGSWAVIGEMIDESLCAQGVHVTIYDLPEQAAPAVAQPSLFQT